MNKPAAGGTADALALDALALAWTDAERSGTGLPGADAVDLIGAALLATGRLPADPPPPGPWDGWTCEQCAGPVAPADAERQVEHPGSVVYCAGCDDPDPRSRPEPDDVAVLAVPCPTCLARHHARCEPHAEVVDRYGQPFHPSRLVALGDAAARVPAAPQAPS